VEDTGPTEHDQFPAQAEGVECGVSIVFVALVAMVTVVGLIDW